MRNMARAWIFLLLLAAATGVQAKEKLVFSAIEQAPHGVMGAAVLKEAYRKIGIEVDIYYTSGRRSLLISSAGTVDGEVSRVEAVGKIFTSLERIEIPLMQLETAVFISQTHSEDWSFDDLPKLRVGYLNGATKMEAFTKGFPDVWVGHSNRELFEMLLAGHLDAVVTSLETGRVTARQVGAEGIVVMERLVQQENLYHYLHRKNRDLAPKITAVLKQMTESGELEAILNATMDELLTVGYPEFAVR
mgnify:CR=1 FL=1